jgi:hypothetical protein
MIQCPHCFGPLPVPPERYCPHCGAALEDGAPALPAPEATQGGIPWENGRPAGWLTALVETTQQVLGQPTAFYARMPRAGGIGQPVLYALIVGFVGILASAMYQAILKGVLGPSLMGLGGHSPVEQLAPFLEGGVGLVVQVAFAPVSVLFSIFLGAGVLHVMLLLLDAAEGGFEATLRVRCYAEAAAVLNILPFCGVLLQVVALIILLVIGLSAVHRTSRGRATAAVLLPAFFVCCCCGAVVLAFASAIVAFVGRLHP